MKMMESLMPDCHLDMPDCVGLPDPLPQFGDGPTFRVGQAGAS